MLIIVAKKMKRCNLVTTAKQDEDMLLNQVNSPNTTTTNKEANYAKTAIVPNTARNLTREYTIVIRIRDVQ